MKSVGRIARFGEFAFDLDTLRLSRAGLPLQLEPQPGKLLKLLLESPDRIITRQEARERIWGTDTNVEFDQGLAYCVRQIRRALRDDGTAPKYIETIPREGFRILVPVELPTVPAPVCVPPAKMQLPWRRFVIAAALVLSVALGVAAAAYFWRGRSESLAPLVLVMPLANLSGDASVDYIVDGTTSEMIRRLSEFTGLRVIGRSTSLRLKARNLDTIQAASATGAQAIIHGSVRRDASELVADIEVAEGATGSVILSRTYHQFGVNTQAFLPAVVEDVCRSLNVRLREVEKTRFKKVDTAYPEAWSHYLRGEQLTSVLEPPNLTRAIGYFEKAIRVDPGFARAYSSLATAHTLLGLYFDDPRRHFPEARRQAEQALALNDSLQEPQSVLGLIALTYDWNFTEAQHRLVLGSGRIRAEASLGLGCTAHLMAAAGRLNGRADDEIHAALTLNPLAVAMMGELGCNAYYGREYERALDRFQRALAMKADDTLSLWGMGKSLVQLKRYSEAIETLSRVPQVMGNYPPLILGELGYAKARAGDAAGAKAVLETLRQMSSKVYVDPFFLAVIHRGLDDRNATMVALNEAYKVRSTLLISILSDPKWDGLETDTRFVRLRDRVSLGQ